MDWFNGCIEKVISMFPKPVLPSATDKSTMYRIIDELSKDDNAMKAVPIDSLNNQLPDISEDDAIAAGALRDQFGFEARAFYKSFHYRDVAPFHGKWGIFIFDWAHVHLTKEIFTFYKGRIAEAVCRSIALKYLLTHERFHFYFDLWVVSHEIPMKKVPLYTRYVKEIYSKYAPDEICFEESLANRHVMDCMDGNKRKYPSLRKFIQRDMFRQPPAYAGFNRDVNEMREELAAQVFCGKKYKPWACLFDVSENSPDSKVAFQSSWLAHGREDFLKDENCPVYYITGVTASRILYPCFIQEIDEHADFVKSYLAGEYRGDSKGHSLYKIDNGEVLKVPIKHKNIDRMLRTEFRNNLRKAGMEMPLFQRERERTQVWKKNVPRPKPMPRRMVTD